MKRNPDKSSTPLYQITLNHDADDSRIAEIKNINSFAVRIEKMKKSQTVQCKRCQRFSHTSHQCFFDYRCVQCINKHKPGECPRIKNKSLPIGCINCAEAKLKHNGHTANNLEKCGQYNKILLQSGNNAKSNTQYSATIPKQNVIIEEAKANDGKASTTTNKPNKNKKTKKNGTTSNDKTNKDVKLTQDPNSNDDLKLLLGLLVQFLSRLK